MKKLILSISIFAGTLAFAGNSGTQDNLIYNITIKKNANFRACAVRICQIAKAQTGGLCQAFSAIRIISADLTTYGVELVKKTNCALAIEEDRPVEAYPRVGRQN